MLCLVVLSAAGASAAPPVAFDRIAPAVAEDTTTQVRLPYQNADGDRATSCSVTSQMLTLEQACQCDAAGACSVGVQGLPDAHGEASFAYDITAGGETSPRATVRLEVLPTADRPQAVTSRHPAFAVNAAAILELPYRDPDGPPARVE